MTHGQDSAEQATASSPLRYRRTRLRGAGVSTSTVVVDDAADVPEDTADHWLDQVTSEDEQRRRSVAGMIIDSFASPYLWSKRVFSYLLTTPGRLLTMTIVLSIAILAAGYSMSQSSAERQSNLNSLLNTTEPMSYSAHNLYTSLSLADTIATTGFVQTGVESAGTRARYNAAIDRAIISASESAASIGTGDRQALNLVTDIERQIPVYTGLVETARTNNRVGNPVGVAYMAEASSLMRDEILPAAAQLFEHTSSNVRTQQANLSRPQWVPLSGLLAAVLFLSLAQYGLWKVTRRRLNKGFLFSTALMLVAIMWVSASNYSAWQAGTRGFEEASTPWDSLTASRIQAQQARTAETLALVRRQSVAESGNQFDNAITAVNRALDEFEQAEGYSIRSSRERNKQLIAEARTALQNWSHGYDRFTAAMFTGDYSEAVRLSTSTTAAPGEPVTSASAYASLDSALSRLIADARSSMRAYIYDSLAATRLVAAAVLLLSLLAILAVWLGVRPRLQEYL